MSEDVPAYGSQAGATLQGKRVRLEPLSLSHVPALRPHADEAEIWEFLLILKHGRPDAMDLWVENAIKEARDGTSFPYAVVDQATGVAVGSTSLYEYSAPMKRITVGHSWLSRSCWGSGINTEAKYLLFKHCFESLGIRRLQTRVDVMNLRSHKAVEKLGFVPEGVLRSFLLYPDGRPRNLTMFSLLDTEWSAGKEKLLSAFAHERSPTKAAPPGPPA